MGNYMYYKKKGPEYNKLGELHGLPKVTLRVSPMEQTGGVMTATEEESPIR